MDALVEESPEFAGIWRSRPVLSPCAPQAVPPPRLGTLDLHCQTLVDPDRSQRLVVFTATLETESDTNLRLLSLLPDPVSQNRALHGRASV